MTRGHRMNYRLRRHVMNQSTRSCCHRRRHQVIHGTIRGMVRHTSRRCSKCRCARSTAGQVVCRTKLRELVSVRLHLLQPVNRSRSHRRCLRSRNRLRWKIHWAVSTRSRPVHHLWMGALVAPRACRSFLRLCLSPRRQGWTPRGRNRR